MRRQRNLGAGQRHGGGATRRAGVVVSGVEYALADDGAALHRIVQLLDLARADGLVGVSRSVSRSAGHVERRQILGEVVATGLGTTAGPLLFLEGEFRTMEVAKP